MIFLRKLINIPRRNGIDENLTISRESLITNKSSNGKEKVVVLAQQQATSYTLYSHVV